jgi:ribose/xylose/arabinose/galactoside ABC-type transport system permease subunit
MTLDTRPAAATLEPTQERSTWLRGPRPSVQVVGVYVALAVLWVGFSFKAPYFFTVQNVINLLTIASTLSLIAAGLTIVLIAGEIDLSFAAMQAFVGSVAAVVIINHGVWWPLGMVIAVAVGTLAGVVSGVVTVVAQLQTFITTLAMLGIVQGTAYLLTNGEPVSGFPPGYEVLGTKEVGPFPVAIFVVAGIYVLLYILLNHTVFGMQVHAVGGNRAAAAAVGISWRKIVIGVLALSACLASISGLIITARLGAGSGSYGADDLLPAVAGVIIGGTSLTGGVGTLMGTFGGIMIVVTINNGLVLLNVNQFWTQVVVGLIIMGAVVIDQVTRGYLASHSGERDKRRSLRLLDPRRVTLRH